VETMFMEEIHRIHGIPKIIVSDKDPKLTGNFWKEIWKMHGTTLVMSFTYHPQTYGQKLIIRKYLEGYL
jgi:hypothetical protein